MVRPLTLSVSIGLAEPMSNECDTMRVPGFSCELSFGISRRLSDGSRYSVTTVASLMSVVNRSWLRNFTRSPTAAILRFSLASRIRCGSMSMPTARAP